MQYVSRETGEPITEMEDLLQSITDILTTPKGSRVKLRGYGSDLPRFVDRPTTSTFPIEVFGEVAGALDEWEPRIIVKRVYLSDESSLQTGSVVIDMEGVYLPTGQPFTLQRIQLFSEASIRG